MIGIIFDLRVCSVKYCRANYYQLLRGENALDQNAYYDETD